MLRSVRGRRFVRSAEVVRSSECPLSEVPLYHFIFIDHVSSTFINAAH